MPFEERGHVAGHGIGGDNHHYSGYHGYWPTDDARRAHGVVLRHARRAARRSSPPRTRRASRCSSTTRWCTCTIDSPVYAQHTDWFWPNRGTAATASAAQNCAWDTQARALLVHRLPAALELHERGRARLLGRTPRCQLDEGHRARDGFRARRDQARRHLVAHGAPRADQIADRRRRRRPQQRFYMVGETYDFGEPRLHQVVRRPDDEARRAVRLPAAREPRRRRHACARRRR